MPLDLDTFNDIVNRFRADLTNSLPGLDPTIIGSFIRAMVDGFSGRMFESNLTIDQVVKQSFVQTATGIYLEYIAARDGLRRNPAAPARGYVVATGVLGVNVPRETLLTSANNVTLKTTEAATTQNVLTSVVQITRVGTTAKVRCSSKHNLASGIYAEVGGAELNGYNGRVLVTVIDEFIFDYEVDGDLATPATGDISVAFIGVVLPVETEGTGQGQNIGAGAGVEIQNPPIGLDPSAFINPLSVDGGTEIEEDEALRARTLEKSSSLLSMFNVAAISVQAKTVPGVTRVFVKEYFPEAGATTVYFMRDNDLVPIPSAIDIENVRIALNEFRPAPMESRDLIIKAPQPVVVDILIRAISPDTAAMRANITASLVDYFKSFVKFELNVSVDRIKTAIYQAQDMDTGEFLQEFTLENPVADIVVVPGRLATLGSVTIT